MKQVKGWWLPDIDTYFEHYIKNKGSKNFKYYFDIEINNKKTALTWTEKQF